MDHVKSQQTVGHGRMPQLLGIHIDRSQCGNRQKYAGRCQPALDAASFAGVGRSLRSANKTLISVSVQVESLPAGSSFRTCVLCALTNLGEPRESAEPA